MRSQNAANSSIYRQYKNRSKETGRYMLKHHEILEIRDEKSHKNKDDQNQTFPVVALTRPQSKQVFYWFGRECEYQKELGLIKMSCLNWIGRKFHGFTRSRSPMAKSRKHGSIC